MAEWKTIPLPSVTTEEPTAALRWVPDRALGKFGQNRLQQAIKIIMIDKDGKTIGINHEWRDVPFENSP